ncbi:MAG: hypothetical protein Kow00121_57020 [Elainellaceae cyanobacterium]
MIITDLNYLESVQEDVVGGLKFSSDNFKVTGVFAVVSLPLIKGNSATAQANANAYGSNTFTAAQSDTKTTWYSSSSTASSISITA